MRALLLAVALTLPVPALAALACPDTLQPEGAPPPFERQGLGAGRARNAPLLEAWLLAGVPGEETKPAPAILAPDESRGTRQRFTNTWRLTEEPLVLACIYRDGVWLRAALPAGLTRCVQAGEGARVTMRCE